MRDISGETSTVFTLTRRQQSTMTPAKNNPPDTNIMAPTGTLLWTASVALIKPLKHDNKILN